VKDTGEHVTQAEVDAAPASPGRPAIVGVVLSLLAIQFLTAVGGGVIGAFFAVDLIRQGVAPLELSQRLMADRGFLLAALIVSQGAMVLVVRVISPRVEQLPEGAMRARVGWDVGRFRLLHALLLLAGSLSLGTMLIGTLRLVAGEDLGVLVQFERMSSEATGFEFGLLLLVGALLAGITEEVLFRGFVQRRFVERWGPLKGVVITSVLFGVWHIDVRQGLFAMAVGLWFGLGAQRTGTIVTGAIAHILNNVASFVLSRAFPGEEDLTQLPLSIGVATVVFFGCLAALLATTRTPPPSAAPS
jgi:membrane protease YdiL (CAAX protease family)